MRAVWNSGAGTFEAGGVKASEAGAGGAAATSGAFGANTRRCRTAAVPGEGAEPSGACVTGPTGSISGVTKISAVVTPKPTAKPVKAMKNDFFSNRARRRRAGGTVGLGLACFGVSRASGRLPHRFIGAHSKKMRPDS